MDMIPFLVINMHASKTYVNMIALVIVDMYSAETDMHAVTATGFIGIAAVCIIGVTAISVVTYSVDIYMNMSSLIIVTLHTVNSNMNMISVLVIKLSAQVDMYAVAATGVFTIVFGGIGSRADRIVTSGTGHVITLVRLVITVDKLVDSHAIERCQCDKVIGIRRGLRSLPFGHRLAADTQLFGKILLRITVNTAIFNKSVCNAYIHVTAPLLNSQAPPEVALPYRPDRLNCVPGAICKPLCLTATIF